MIFENLPTGKYDVIAVDPPWPVKKIKRKSRPNQVDMDYPTISVSEIAQLPVGALANESSVCFLWTTHRFLPESFSLFAGWGFKYQRCVTWDKSNGMCLFGFHHRTEFILFGYRGKLEMYPTRKAFPTLIAEKSPRHSAKPDCFYAYAGQFGERRLDMFARGARAGWDVWGNEV